MHSIGDTSLSVFHFVVFAAVVRVCDCVQETSKSEQKEGVPDGCELGDRLGVRHGSSGEPRGA